MVDGVALGVLLGAVLGVVVHAAMAPAPARADEAPASSADPTLADLESIDDAAGVDLDAEERAVRRDPAFYRGRSREPTAEEVLLWIPRVVLFPLHLVTEYLLRLPVVALLEWAEREHLIAIFDRIFNPTADISWSPTVTLEAGVFALPGLRARWRDMGVPGHALQIAGTFAGDHFWSASVRDEWTIAPVHFGVRGGYSTRPDRAFFGLGPASTASRQNFTETRGEAIAFVGIDHENHVRLDGWGGWSYEAVAPGMFPSIQIPDETAEQLGIGPLELVLVALDLTLDTRREREENGGVRLHANGTYGLDTRTGAHSFVTVDVDVEAAVEVSHPDRVLAARVHVAETATLGSGGVPFLHLATLGWSNHQGFVLGRFRGEASFLTEVRYRYPIDYFVDLQWTASVGNVFARDFSDFSAGALTGSFGVGVRTRRTGQDPLEVTVAIGTTRFDSNVSIESVRLYISTTQGL